MRDYNITLLMLQLKMGGGNKVFVNLAKKGGKKFRVISTATSHEVDIDVSGINYLKVGFKSKKIMFRILSYLNLLIYVLKNRNKLGYVIYSDPLLFPIILLSHLRSHIRFIQADDIHLFIDRDKINKLFKIIYKNMTKYAYKNEKYIICNSKYTYNCYLKAGGKGKLLGIVHPGIDKNVYRIINGNDRKFDFGILSREEKIKGLDIFLKAMHYLNSKKYRNIIRVSMFANKKISINLENVDFQIAMNDQDNARILNNCKCFIYPSRNEGFGLPPLEAMACGCVVIAADCGGIREYGIDHNNIIIFRQGDYKDLAKKMIFVLENDISEIRKNSLMTAEKMTWDNTYNSFMHSLDTYNKLIVEN